MHQYIRSSEEGHYTYLNMHSFKVLLLLEPPQLSQRLFDHGECSSPVVVVVPTTTIITTTISATAVVVIAGSISAVVILLLLVVVVVAAAFQSFGTEEEVGVQEIVRMARLEPPAVDLEGRQPPLLPDDGAIFCGGPAESNDGYSGSSKKPCSEV